MKTLFALFLIVYSLAVYPQQTPSFVLKTDPVFNLNGRWNIGIEKPLKKNLTWQTNLSLVQVYGNTASSFGNPTAYLMRDVQHQFNSLNGFNAQIQIRKYVNQTHWLSGAFMGAGVGHSQEVLNYSIQNNITPIRFDKQFKFRSAQLFYISGYQGEFKKKIQYAVSAGLGYRTMNETTPYSFEISGMYSRNLYGILQFSMMTPVFKKLTVAKDTTKTSAKPTLRTSVWVNPISIFLEGTGLTGGFSFTTKDRINWTLDAWYHEDKFNNNFFSSETQIMSFQGIKLGARKFTKKALAGFNLGIFTEYNHLEVIERSFLLPIEHEFSTIKDQFAFGMQYGYVFMSSSGIFLDINGNSGIRFGNAPQVEASRMGNFRLNFNNGTYNKLFLKIGYAF